MEKAPQIDSQFNSNLLHSQTGTYLPHSTLDTPPDFCIRSQPLIERCPSYTELAFEPVWLVSYPFPVRRDQKFVCLDAEKSKGQKGGAGRVASSNGLNE
jgi:hypothetical protein